MSDIEQEVDLNKSFERLLLLREDENCFDLSSYDEKAVAAKRSESEEGSDNSENFGVHDDDCSGPI